MKTIVLAAVALSACTHSDRIAVLSASAVALTACDVRQTLAVSCGGRWDCPARDGYYYQESNPLLGSSPGVPRLVGSAMVVETGVVWVAATDRVPPRTGCRRGPSTSCSARSSPGKPTRSPA